jgi:predicted Zn-dependent protease
MQAHDHMATPPGPLAATYFDGSSPRARPVTLTLAPGQLELRGPDVERDIALAGLAWPERQRHGPRVLHLPDGSSIECRDGPGWEALAMAAGRRDSAVVQLQQSWRATLLALLLVAVTLAGAWVWGIPLAGRGVTALLPQRIDTQLGRGALESLDQRWLKPSHVPAARQAELRALMQQALQRAAALHPHELGEAHLRVDLHLDLQFRDAGPTANAFALPGGTVVVTDALLALADGRDDMLIGVLGHEAGHVAHRHALRLLVQASLVSAASSALLGDFSTWLAAAPALLGQFAYTRDLEREADQVSLDVLRANGYDGRPMVDFFERLQADPDRTARPGAPDRPASAGDEPGERRTAQDDSALATLLSTHPVHAERIAFFRQRR